MSTAEMDHHQVSLASLDSLVQEQRSTVDAAEQQQSSQSTTQLRERLVPTLEAADKSRKCHLLEIAAELRNCIYEYLLNTGDLKTCHPQILATCTRIRDEASCMLYANQQFTIRIRGLSVSVEGRECGELLLGDPVLDTKRIYWPPVLNKVQHLRILRLPPRPVPRDIVPGTFYCRPFVRCGTAQRSIDEVDAMPFMRPFTMILYSLCAHLAEKNQIKTVEVDFATQQGIPCYMTEQEEKVLYPLAMLKDLQKLDVFLDKPLRCISEKTADVFLAKLKTHHPRPDLLQSLEPLIEDGETCRKILQILPGGQFFWADRLLGSLNYLQDRLQAKGEKVWMTSERELAIINAEAKLRQVLSYVDAPRLGEQLCHELDKSMEALRKMAARQSPKDPQEDEMKTLHSRQYEATEPVQPQVKQQPHPQFPRDWRKQSEKFANLPEQLKKWHDFANNPGSFDVGEKQQQLPSLQIGRPARSEEETAKRREQLRQWNYPF